MSIIYLINSQCENDNKMLVAQLARVQNLSVQLNIFIRTDCIIIYLESITSFLLDYDSKESPYFLIDKVETTKDIRSQLQPFKIDLFIFSRGVAIVELFPTIVPMYNTPTQVGLVVCLTDKNNLIFRSHQNGMKQEKLT